MTLSREWRAKQQKYDKANMAEVIDRFSQQLRGALEVELPELPEGDFGEVVVVGMGGSALPVDVITCAYDEELRVPLRVWRNYGLPKDVRDDTLIILSSFSGGTEEVLEALEEMEGRSRTVVISAGGELTERARRRELPVIRLPIEHEPEGFQPRSAVGYFVALLYRTLLRTNLIVGSERELTETSEFLEGVDSWREAEEASEWLQDKIPIIYTDRMYVSAVARIAKIKFNENAKVPAFFNELPEANHNELTGFLGDLGTFGIFLLHSAESHPMIWERFCVMQETFMAKGIENVAFRSWTMPGKTRLQRILASLLFMEQCSYLLALRRHVDPSPVELVEEFKARLAGVRTSSGTS